MHDEDLRSYVALRAPVALSLLEEERGGEGEEYECGDEPAGTEFEVPGQGRRRGEGEHAGECSGGGVIIAGEVFGSAEQRHSSSASMGGHSPSQQHVTFSPMDVTGGASPPGVSYRMGAASSASSSSWVSSTGSAAAAIQEASVADAEANERKTGVVES